MVYYLKKGETLPLNCFLDGEEADKFIRVRVFGSNGQLVGEANLTHIESGYYHNVSEVVMPEDAIVVALYEIFDDALLTKKSDVYTTVVDQFLPAVVSVASSNVDMALDASRELIGHIELI